VEAKHARRVLGVLAAGLAMGATACVAPPPPPGDTTTTTASVTTTTSASTTTTSASTTTTSASTTTTTPASGLPRPDHVVVVVEENHSASAILGNASAPYINSLAAGGASFTESYATHHPSQPNYLALFSGSNQGVTNDACPPPGSPYSAANLGGQLIAAGLSFAGYSEDLPAVGSTVCSNGGSPGYQRKHNPWVDFTDVPAASNQPFTAFPTDYSTLPTISFVVPNQIHDMHDGTVAQGDTWLHDNLDGYAQWATTHNSLLIVTWDEDDYLGTNKIATIFSGAPVVTGTYAERIDHYRVLRTLQDMYGLPPAGNSATATAITDCWTS